MAWHTAALLRKTTHVKRRACCATSLELGLPLLLLGGLIGIFYALRGVVQHAAAAHLEQAVAVPPFAACTGALLARRQVLGVAPATAADAPLVDAFWAHAAALYAGFNVRSWA
jgi:hypothetical protein